MDLQLIHILWTLVSAALVFIMQGGFALLESGLTRSKNSINVSVKNITDFGISVTVYWVLGFGIMFGPGLAGFIGTGDFFFSSQDLTRSAFFFFQVMFASTAATIVSGAVAERMKFSAYILVTIVISAAIYPVVGHWIWNLGTDQNPGGWLAERGFVDFAGSTAVHSVGGWVSLAALLVIGPRIGRYGPNGEVRRISGSNLPNAVTGVILLFFGWFGFNGGSTLALNSQVPVILINTTLAGAAGLLGALLVGWPLYRLPDVSLVINGVLGGLVAITAGCHSMSPQDSLLIGAVGGALTIFIQELLDRLRIDDAVGAIPVHLGAGIWGTVAVALFGDPGVLATGLDWAGQLGAQALGIGAAGLYSFTVSWIIFGLLDRIRPLRVSAADELKGLNAAEHAATTEIYDLFQTLESQAKTGDLSLRAPVEPFTEVGQIAQQYNKVMDSLEHNLVARSEYVSILDNVQDGLLLLDKDGRLGPFYSSALEKILERTDLAGQSLGDLLQPLVTESVMTSLQDFLEVLFDGSLDFRTVSRLNPLEKVDLHLDRGQGQLSIRHVSFKFRRLEDQGEVTRAMVIVSDLTQQRKLEQTMDLERKTRNDEMELFYTILHLDPVLLQDFASTYEERILRINRLFEAGQGVPQNVLKQAYRALHGIKGEAALLSLGFIVDAVHRTEDLIKTLLEQENPGGEDFISLALRLGELTETGVRMKSVLGKMQEFQKSFAKLNQEGSQGGSVGFLESLESMVLRMGKETGKKASLNASHLDPGLFPSEKKPFLRQLLVQLVRNSLVHGIEAPQERRKAGKSPIGQITLWSEKTKDSLVLSYRDDGRGLDIEALKKKALAQGKTPEVLALWQRPEWIRYAFSGMVSTASEVTSEAGRGVGLSLVRELVQKVGAKLVVNFTPGQGIEFRLVWDEAGQ